MSTSRLDSVPAIVPRPLALTLGNPEAGGAALADGLVIACAPDLVSEARWLRRELEAGTGWSVHLAATDEASDPTIELRLGPLELPADLAGSPYPATIEESYRLDCSRDRVVITSPSGTGAFYGLQTLRQLLPDATFRKAGCSGPIRLPELEIVDAPRLPWRGVLLDVARHFMPKAFILELIDLVALHKCNVMHLHLTDDQGWRLAVERYPRLVEIGAWRRQSPSSGSAEGLPDGKPHGGYYSRRDLEEIVSFAAERHVHVLPEIDMPGHVLAAIAAYPWLGNGEARLEVGTTWGVSNHVLNLEERTLRFCTDVLDEVCDVFPWPFVHVGGDECPTDEWQTSPRAREIMQAQGYTDERQLQGWFTARLASRLAERGRTLVAWDDILERGAPAHAVLMAWQDEERGAKAVSAGHDVVMVPQEWLYLDRPASADPAEPVGFPGVTSLEKVYLHDPVPPSIPAEDRHHVLGAQCQLWTEHVPTPAAAEYLYFPRLSAFAETVWTIESPEHPRSYEEFEGRLRQHLGRLAAIGVNYRPLEGPTPGQARFWPSATPAGAEAAR